MISNFPLWTFYLYVATFQQHLHMEYIALRACGSFQERVAANKEAVEVITSKVLRSPPWLSRQLWNICVANDHGYVPLVVNTSRFFPHSWLITGFVTRLTRRVPLVEQELLPEHLSPPPVFCGVSYYSIVVCPFVLFLLAIVLSVLLRFKTEKNAYKHINAWLSKITFIQLYLDRWYDYHTATINSLDPVLASSIDSVSQESYEVFLLL